MANYNQFKQAWDSMDDTQRKQAVEQNKNNAQFQQFAQQYNNEVNWWSVNVQQVVQQANKNWNLNNTTNQWTNTQWSTTTNQNQTNANGTNWQNNTNNSEINNWWTTWTDKSVVSQDFDQSRLTNDNAQVSVKEWTASQTWMPDYEADSDARDNEIVNNLNAYINSNPEFFTDRNTFNQSFHYSERNSRQKALLDSFWKGQEDKKTASNYNTGDAIATGMKNSDITPDIMNLIRQNNPEAYAEWQKQMQEEINKRIANFTTPADPYSTADLFKSLVEKLNIEPEDPLQIYDNWYWMCERLGVFKDSDKLANQQAQIEANHKQIENITKKYSSNAWWATSSALSAARLNKALQPYLAIESSLQNEYSLLLQWRNSNLAIANQSANAMVMQANENQRIFNQKLSWLGFAVTTAWFRTPEQTLQNQLNYQSALNDLNLLNQSKQNDLARYNLYANTKLQNQLNSELSNLDVDDPVQQRANLNNVVGQYFSKYWDIIQRSQSQVVDDILAYAKEKGISVWEALSENFIKQLQNKPEFRNMIASNYAAPTPKVSINEDWTVDFSAYTAWGVKYTPVSAFKMNSWLQDFMNNHASWSDGWWCGKFVNDYLQSIWIWRLYWDSLSSKLNTINTEKTDVNNLAVWSVAVFDYSRSSGVWENAKNYGHVAIVTEIDKENWMVKLMESNYKWDKKVTTERWIDVNKAPSLQWFFDPSKWSGKWTLSSWDEAKKNNYLEEAKRWMLTDTMIWKIWDIAAEQWWSDEWQEALKQGKSTNLTDAQIKLMDKTDSQFSSNAIVKEFESAINQIEQLQTALNDKSWVGDMSAIFTFMKTLDPSSVVRESEFNSAAATAWILNPSAIWQKLEKNANGKFLTQKQREDFKEIAKQFIKTKASNYQVKYNDLLKRYWEYWIDSSLAPTNMADLVLNSLEWWTENWGQGAINWYNSFTTVWWQNWTWDIVNVWWTTFSSNFYDN